MRLEDNGRDAATQRIWDHRVFTVPKALYRRRKQKSSEREPQSFLEKLLRFLSSDNLQTLVSWNFWANGSLLPKRKRFPRSDGLHMSDSPSLAWNKPSIRGTINGTICSNRFREQPMVSEAASGSVGIVLVETARLLDSIYSLIRPRPNF